ncbi:MAG TPA: aminotransferase class V-fold PLP-dependent enzyme [Pyrinomonadaceae bacterium]|jgi:selenocysteine lyase/cysteine desulfurase|nr:aminotransferase class V-fold PLP-dependent enzyme [Pyrinomonadaceae bacterium]
MINWADVRAKFPVTRRSVYLNTAAAGPLAESTAKAGAEYYELMMTDGDVHWDTWLARREEVRKQVAAFINAEPEEIGFTTNTSSGMNLIVDALEKHGEVISCDLEFPVTTIAWMHRRIPVHLVKAVGGVVHPDAIRAAMNTRTGIISMSYVQFSNGFRTDIEELASIKGNHALVINASQAAGVFEIDVKRMKIDALCTTGHKWMLSGYGSGFVFISKELQAAARQRTIGWLSVHDPYGLRNDEVHLRHDMSARAELGCPHFAGVFALGASIELMQSIGMANIEARALELNRVLTAKLSEIGWKVLSPLDDERIRSAETLVAAENPAKIVADLASQKILVTEKPQGFRVATDFFNNEEDTDQLIHRLLV